LRNTVGSGLKPYRNSGLLIKKPYRKDGSKTSSGSNGASSQSGRENARVLRELVEPSEPVGRSRREAVAGLKAETPYTQLLGIRATSGLMWNIFTDH